MKGKIYDGTSHRTEIINKKTKKKNFYNHGKIAIFLDQIE